MSVEVKPIPEGQNAVTPYLVIKGAAEAIGFYEKAFGAVEKARMPMPDGRVGHAELRIVGSTIYLADEYPEWGILSPTSLGGSGVGIHLYVEDADATYDRAVEAGATATMPLVDAFWGDRYGKLTDPFGHIWSIATHKEDLTPEQVAERGAAEMAAMC